MKKIVSIISLLIIAVACCFGGAVYSVSANAQAENLQGAQLSANDRIDQTVERLSFDDLYLSSLTQFDESNARESMFGGFVETEKARIEKSFEFSYDITVLETPDANSVFGLGVRNVATSDKVNLIQSGGYEILFGKNDRLDGIASTSFSTVSIVKNGALNTQTKTGAVEKYAVFTLPAWLVFEENAEMNLKIGSVRIVAQDKPLDTKGYYVYVTATQGNNTAKIAEVYDYCDNGVNIGSAATGIVKGAGKYSILSDASSAKRGLEAVNSYDILQLDQGKTSYYNVINQGLFGRARTATDNSLEVSMRVLVDTPAKTWHMFSIGLKNCYYGEFDHFIGGYEFRIGRNTHIADSSGNSNDTLSIFRNGLPKGSGKYTRNVVKLAKMPEAFKQDMFTKGASFKLTVGLRRIVAGEEILGYYAYMKHNGETVLDFYDYFDYEKEFDYFGDVFTGGIEAEGAYYLTTCGETDREFEDFNVYDLSSLVPVTQSGLVYEADAVGSSTEKVISRYVTGESSIGVRYKVKFSGSPVLDLSLSALDDSTKADGIRFKIDERTQSFRVYTIATKFADFDSGDIDFSARGMALQEDREYLLEYGVVRYKYVGCDKYEMAQVYLRMDGVDLYRYDIDYMRSVTLGYYAGGRVTGEAGDKVTLIPTEDNQLTVSVTASTLKQDVKIGERNAIDYQTNAPMGLTKVEYKCVSGEENVLINEYGAVTGLKAGTAVVKVLLHTQYGTYESNEVTLTVSPLQAQAALEYSYMSNTWIALCIGLGVIAVAGIASVITVIIIKKKKLKGEQE